MIFYYLGLMTVSMLQSSQKLVKMLITDYLIEFDHLYHKMTDQRLSFPTTVLISYWKVQILLRLNENQLFTWGSHLEFNTMKSFFECIFKKFTAVSNFTCDTVILITDISKNMYWLGVVFFKVLCYKFAMRNIWLMVKCS